VTNTSNHEAESKWHFYRSESLPRTQTEEATSQVSPTSSDWVQRFRLLPQIQIGCCDCNLFHSFRLAAVSVMCATGSDWLQCLSSVSVSDWLLCLPSVPQLPIGCSVCHLSHSFWLAAVSVCIISTYTN